MVRKSALAAAISAVLMPSVAHALGLGDIKLNSVLNEPLDAEIELVAAQPGELSVLSADIASLETFNRYGLDRPDFLNSLRFRVLPLGNGGAKLKVTSTQPITEPFVTFLLEANWNRGRLLREYTVLLDPPVFNPNAATSSVTAPQSAASQLAPTAGVVPPAPRRPEPRYTPPSRETRLEQPRVAVVGGANYGPVRRNETLWAISRSALAGRSDLSMNQMMVAIYRANPEAFLGNINLLKEGSTLRIPEGGAVAEVSRGDALATAKQHNAAWRSGSARVAGSAVPSSTPAASTSAATREERRLRLVAPDDAPAADGGSLADLRGDLENAQARNSELADENETLRREIEETRRLLNVQSSDLADMQATLAQQGGTETAGDPADSTPAVVDSGSTDTPPADTVTTGQTPADAIADTATTAGDGATGTPADSTTTDTTTVATTGDTGADAPAVAQPAVATTPATSEPSFLSKVLGYWPWLLGLLALGGGAFAALRLSRSNSEAESWDALATDADDAAASAAADGEDAGESQVEYFEDTGTFKPVDFGDATRAENAAVTVDEAPFEDTLSGSEPLNLDQSDPLAEADFHMAYGLYDQAAELVKSASDREPSRRDLKMKLLEIFFVWGNKDAFASAAGELKEQIVEPDADWDKILIMGRQICPDMDLFSGEAGGAGAEAVDLQLEQTGEATFDLYTDAGDDDDATSVDLDLGGALDAASAASVAAGDDVIDFDMGGAPDLDPTDAVKQQIVAAADDAEDTEEMDLAELGIDLDFGDADSVETGTFGGDLDALGDAADEPVVASDDGDFDALFGGLDDPTATAVGSAPDTVQIEAPREGDKLLDTSELRVEMEQLLAAGDGDENTARNLAALAAEDVPDSGSTIDALAAGTDDTGSFSAEIRALSEDSFDESLDFSISGTDLDSAGGSDDDTVLMESPPDANDTLQTPAATVAAAADDDGEFADIFAGSDDDTVLAESLGDFADEEEIDFSDAFAATTSGAAEQTLEMPKAGAAITTDLSGVFESDGDEPTQLSESPFGGAQPEAGGDDLTFQGVFEESDEAVDIEMGDLGDDIFGSDGGTQELPNIDLDVGDSMDEQQSGDNTTQKVAAGELALPDSEATAANEVGTKLDLARAYMEMGDPDGARGILEEVMEEGDGAQRQDARALLDALP